MIRSLLFVVFILGASAQAWAQQESSHLIGKPLPRVFPLAPPNGAGSKLSKETLDQLLDLPSADGLDSLLTARPINIQRRGGKEIAINKILAPASVFIQQGNSTCTGALVSTDGKVITCWHCVRGKDEVYVRLHPSSGESKLLTAKIIRTNPATDLALLQLPIVPKNVKPLELGRPEDFEVGADVYAVGHPAGLHWSFVKGLVSQVYEKRVWQIDRNRHEAEVIQAHIALYEGNSGGPLVSEEGRLIGINASKRDKEAFTFSIALPEIQKFLGEPADKIAAVKAKPPRCKRKMTAEGRSERNDATVMLYDTNCDGKPDTSITVPDLANGEIIVAKVSAGNRIRIVRTSRQSETTTYLADRKGQVRAISR
jgi:S1-C subfamily serine protease